MDKCDEHATSKLKGKPKPKGKPCVQIIAEGKCFKEKCRLFPKVLRILPKLKKMRELQAQGIILTTVWDFSPKAEAKRQKRKKEAEKWLKELYPRIMAQISKT